MNKKILKFINGSLAGLMLFISLPLNTKALSKEETVYGKLDSNGIIKNVFVNEHLINNDKLDTINDYTELKNILNLNGDETYDLKDSKIIWNANENDIFYQGNYEGTLPIDLNITYKLDGKEMKASDMLGKSGKVEIIVKYTNNDKHNMFINGKYETIYTPFVITFGTSIDEKNNQNITINNGKVVSNGTKNFIVGLSTPGLYESLKVSNLKGLDTIKISYDTTSFELGPIYSIVTPKLLSNEDLKIFDKIDNLTNKVNTLQKNMDLIENSSLKLYNGSTLIKNKLSYSIEELKNNKGNVLSDKELENIGLNASNSIKEIFTDEYKEKIGNDAWTIVSSKLTTSSDVTKEITNIVSTSVNETVINYLKSVGEYEDYIKCNSGDENSCLVIANDKTLPYVKEAALNASSDSSKKASNYVSNYTAKSVTKIIAPIIAENSASRVASNVAKEVAKEVSNTVRDESVKSISNSLTELYNGINELDNGLKELSEGITKFNDEGINSISKLVNGDIKSLSSRVKALTKLSNDYKTIQNTKKLDGNSKLIYVIDEQKYVPNKVENEVKEEKLTFFDRIKNLFK